MIQTGIWKPYTWQFSMQRSLCVCVCVCVCVCACVACVCSVITYSYKDVYIHIAKTLRDKVPIQYTAIPADTVLT